MTQPSPKAETQPNAPARGEYHLTVGRDQAGRQACDLLQEKTRLSKQKIKSAMNKGAVHIKRRPQKTKRLRRATFNLQTGDELHLYYDEHILNQTVPDAGLIADLKSYSVWYKPPGMLTQGTHYGDHCALSRWVEKKWNREIFVVHRLDREAQGLVLMAHHRAVAHQLSEQFRGQHIRKIYLALVKGLIAEEGVINTPLDGKSALTTYRRLHYNSADDQSWIEVEIQSGRKHQIRRHLTESGHPVMGDPRYGADNVNPDGMHLIAFAYEFDCPVKRIHRRYDLTQLSGTRIGMNLSPLNFCFS